MKPSKRSPGSAPGIPSRNSTRHMSVGDKIVWLWIGLFSVVGYSTLCLTVGARLAAMASSRNPAWISVADATDHFLSQTDRTKIVTFSSIIYLLIEIINKSQTLSNHVGQFWTFRLSVAIVLSFSQKFRGASSVVRLFLPVPWGAGKLILVPGRVRGGFCAIIEVAFRHISFLPRMGKCLVRDGN